MKTKILYLGMVLFVAAARGYGQKETAVIFPEVGQPSPFFTLHNVTYYPKTEASLSDFRGKWLVLDFWNEGCGSCVESFPKTSAMQKQFANKVQFMLVGIQDQENKIRQMYAKFRAAEQLIMPCAFDSSLSNRWGIYSCPHLVIIGPDGIVRGVTNSLNADQLDQFIHGGQPKLARTYHTQNEEDPRDRRVPFDPRQSFMIEGNGLECDTCYLFRSVLSKWDGGKQRQYVPSVMDRHQYDSQYRAGRFQALGVSLTWLYLFAYFSRDGWNASDSMYGKYSDKPVLLLRDSSLFDVRSEGDQILHLFCYSLTLPPENASMPWIMKVMRNDLNSYFGYGVTLEERMFPYYKFIVTRPEARARLATTGGPREEKETIPRVSCEMHNIPFARLAPLLSGKVGGAAVLNETGVEGNIDIRLTYPTYDEMMRSLHEHGLDLVKSEKLMKCLVIRDP